MNSWGVLPIFRNGSPASVAGTLQNLLGRAGNAAQGQQPSKEQQPQQNPVQQIMDIFAKKKNQGRSQPPNDLASQSMKRNTRWAG
jgi:hypothetical protein